jgi:hypothetical protein
MARGSLHGFTKKKPTVAEPANTTVAPKSERIRGQTLRLTEDAWRQLKILSIDKGTPAHDLLIEAVNLLFEKHGKPQIATPTPKGATSRKLS